MKKLLLFFLFSGSLDSFSQVTSNPICYDHNTKCVCSFYKVAGNVPTADTTKELYFIKGAYVWAPKPDTLRAIILVTTSPNGIAHSRMGYVVLSDGRKPVYLTCDKKALKLPQVGWGWVEAGEGRR